MGWKDRALCGESEEDLIVMLGRFVEVRKRRGLKFNAGKSKAMVLSGEDGLECNSIRLDHIPKFKCLECVLDDSGTDEAECSRKVPNERRVASAIGSLVNVRVLPDTLLVPVFMYGSEAMLWNEKKISRTMAVQMDNLRDCQALGRWIVSRMHG